MSWCPRAFHQIRTGDARDAVGRDDRTRSGPRSSEKISHSGCRCAGAWRSRGDGPTIDRASGEEKGPRIPEPMVFDLVRPLGARRGEVEFNTLGLVPLTRKTRKVDDVTDLLGLVRRSPDTQGVEWAPEAEFVLTDGIALE